MKKALIVASYVPLMLLSFVSLIGWVFLPYAFNAIKEDLDEEDMLETARKAGWSGRR